jgi:hypothetical protein
MGWSRRSERLAFALASLAQEQPAEPAGLVLDVGDFPAAEAERLLSVIKAGAGRGVAGCGGRCRGRLE